VVDILWAHALPEDGLEHIARHIGEDTVDIMLFVKSGTPESAYQAAIRICCSALHTSSTLADWKLTADNRVNGIISIS